MANAGTALFLVGIFVMIVYGVYVALWDIYTQSDLPLVFKVVTPVIVGGVILLLVAAIRDRLRDKAREKFEEMDS